jgi:hypothetical protein
MCSLHRFKHLVLGAKSRSSAQEGDAKMLKVNGI